MSTLPAFPAYLTGIRFSSCVVSGCTLADNGAVTLATGSFTGDTASSGVMDEFEIQRTRTAAQIQPINSVQDNFVPLASGFTATIGQIRRGDGSSLLAAIAANYNYVQVVVQVTPPGASGPSWTEAVVGMIESQGVAYVAEKNMITLSIRPIGIPAYSGAYSLDPYGF